MSDRYFNLRLKCQYKSSDNDVTNLAVDVKSDENWKRFEPDVYSPGFLLYVYALFSCQHRYMRVNSAERGIVLESCEGELRLIADENWNIQNVSVKFMSKVTRGKPSNDDIGYIMERMKHCPVSTNFRKDVELNNEVLFE